MKAADVEALLDVQNLKVHFPIKKGPFSKIVGYVYAVDDVSLRLGKGETLGLCLLYTSPSPRDS